MTKPEPEWMPSAAVVRRTYRRDWESREIASLPCLRNLIRRTAIKAQIAMLDSEFLDPLCSCHRITRSGVEILVSPCAIHELLTTLRAELAELERGDAT